MEIVEVRQQGPQSIDLTVVLVALGHHKGDGRECNREAEGCDDRIGVKVDLLQGARVRDRLKDDLWKRSQLLEVRLDGVGELSAVESGLYDR